MFQNQQITSPIFGLNNMSFTEQESEFIVQGILDISDEDIQEIEE